VLQCNVVCTPAYVRSLKHAAGRHWQSSDVGASSVCKVLQCVAVCLSVFKCVAVCCSVLQYNAVHVPANVQSSKDVAQQRWQSSAVCDSSAHTHCCVWATPWLVPNRALFLEHTWAWFCGVCWSTSSWAVAACYGVLQASRRSWAVFSWAHVAHWQQQ